MVRMETEGLENSTPGRSLRGVGLVSLTGEHDFRAPFEEGIRRLLNVKRGHHNIDSVRSEDRKFQDAAISSAEGEPAQVLAICSGTQSIDQDVVRGTWRHPVAFATMCNAKSTRDTARGELTERLCEGHRFGTCSDPPECREPDRNVW